jgi:mannose-6-phosphate isomerase-like protein (cupin superfamily)
LVPFIRITRANVERDAEPGGANKLASCEATGRKICTTFVMPEFGEHAIDSVDWSVPAVLPTGPGGFEIASFTEFSAQDRHKHDRAVEIYTVLEGRMKMYIDDAGPHVFGSGDEVVILPGTVHEIVQKKRRARNPGEPFEMLVRVHVIGCYGAEDKYVQLEQGQEWRRWSELSREERRRCFKLQGRD